MAILSRQERLQLRILFKGSYHVRHDITILIEVQKISLRTVRIDITDRKSGVHNQIRQFISCKQKCSLGWPVRLCKITFQVDSQAILVFLNTCKVRPVFQS